MNAYDLLDKGYECLKRNKGKVAGTAWALLREASLYYLCSQTDSESAFLTAQWAAIPTFAMEFGLIKLALEDRVKESQTI